MKKYFLTFILFSNLIFSQNWNKKIFNDVILIKDENVFQSGKLILIDIPLKINSGESLIFYNASHVPNKLFFDEKIFLPQVKEFILISPDKEYYKSVREFANRIKGCAEPMKTDKFYFVKRNESKWDSISLNSQNYPTINFKNKMTVGSKNAIVSYYSEFFGSACCPRDKKRDFLTDNKNNYFFEELIDKGIIVKEMYSCSFGHEGEYASFYPLKELSNEQKMIFIKKRRDFFQQDPERYQIFFPEIIDYPNLKLRSLN
ncbi:hypothetical protein [Chryseobacterium geocarposphaerae]|uniref:Uncharacterized protein n=1 Tax=Chryseobacterium geocarposphaerae TaxID=1416776 RepID=A0A2M9C5K1_9FLAO|nr:hypothetical protein [Chryseobacterium geocarposphaerae]PJJ66117.1 hypothetical protein CLV73_0083 [Chryseobacterium geocarposphaerae]